MIAAVWFSFRLTNWVAVADLLLIPLLVAVLADRFRRR